MVGLTDTVPLIQPGHEMHQCIVVAALRQAVQGTVEHQLAARPPGPHVRSAYHSPDDCHQASWHDGLGPLVPLVHHHGQVGSNTCTRGRLAEHCRAVMTAERVALSVGARSGAVDDTHQGRCPGCRAMCMHCHASGGWHR